MYWPGNKAYKLQINVFRQILVSWIRSTCKNIIGLPLWKESFVTLFTYWVLLQAILYLDSSVAKVCSGLQSGAKFSDNGIKLLWRNIFKSSIVCSVQFRSDFAWKGNRAILGESKDFSKMEKSIENIAFTFRKVWQAMKEIKGWTAVILLQKMQADEQRVL